MPDKPPSNTERQGHFTEPERVMLAVLTEDEIRRMIADAEGKHFTDPTPEKTTFSQEELLQNVETGGIDFSTGEHLRKETAINKEKDEEVSKNFKILTEEKFLYSLVPIIWTLTTRGITNNPDEKFGLNFIDKIVKDASIQLVESVGFYLQDSQMKYIADELYKVLETKKHILTPFTSSFKYFFKKVFHYIPNGFSEWKEENSSS